MYRDPTFKTSEMMAVSDKAKSLIKSKFHTAKKEVVTMLLNVFVFVEVLVKEPSKRLTIEQILQDPWISSKQMRKIRLDSMDDLRSFALYSNT